VGELNLNQSLSYIVPASVTIAAAVLSAYARQAVIIATGTQVAILTVTANSRSLCNPDPFYAAISAAIILIAAFATIMGSNTRAAPEDPPLSILSSPPTSPPRSRALSSDPDSIVCRECYPQYNHCFMGHMTKSRK
jgi:hypothetical protein